MLGIEGDLYEDELEIDEEGKVDWSKHREMAVVFGDVIGFSPAINNLTSAGKSGVWRSVANRFGEIGKSIAKKYDADFRMAEGDAIYFYVNLVPHEDYLIRAGELALDFRDSIRTDPILSRLKNENPELGSLEMHMAVDFEEKAELFQFDPDLGRAGYMVIGDGINRAARLMKIEGAEEGEIYTSSGFVDKTRHLLEIKPVLTKGGKLVGIERFKGVGRVSVYQISGKRPGVPRGRALSASNLLGRQEELDKLYRAAEGLSEGTQFSVMINEEAGSGKSRLVKELKKIEGPLFIDFNFTELSKDIELSAVKETIRSKPLTNEQIESLKDDLPFIQDIVDPTKPKSSDYLVTPERRHQALYKLLQTYAAERPVVFVAEDLHWADQESVEFFSYAANRLQKEQSRTGLIVTTRPDIKRDVGTHMPLKPLNKEDSKKLLKERLGSVYQELDDVEGSQSIDTAIELAEGNPFSLEQRAQAYLDTRKRDALVLTPQSITQIIIGRKDRLRRKDLRIALEYISVLGSYSRDFNSSVLERAASLHEERGGKGTTPSPIRITQEVLDELQEGRWITHVRGGVYQISHHTIQEAIYTELGSKSGVHRNVAKALEKNAFERAARKIEELTGLKTSEEAVKTLFIEDDNNRRREAIKTFLKEHSPTTKPASDTEKPMLTPEELGALVEKTLKEVIPVEEISYHWEHSTERLRAVRYLEKARERATNDPVLAVRHCDRALAILDSNIRRLEQDIETPERSSIIRARKERKIQWGTAKANVQGSVIGNYTDAQKTYEDLLVLSASIGKITDNQTNELRLRLGIVYRNRQEFDQAQRVFEELRRIAEATQGIDDNADHFLLAAEVNLGQVDYAKYTSGDSEDKIMLEQVLERFQKTSSYVQDHGERRRQQDKQPDLRIEAGGNFLLNATGNILVELERYKEAKVFFERYLVSVKERLDELASANISIGECYMRLGETELAEERLILGLQFAEKSNIAKYKVHAYQYLGELHCRHGRYVEARGYLTKGLNLANLVWGDKDPEGRVASMRKTAKDYKIGLEA